MTPRLLVAASFILLAVTARAYRDANRIYMRALDEERWQHSRTQAQLQAAERSRELAWAQSDLVAEAADANQKGH